MGAFLGISARTPDRYSSIVSQLLASCEQSPFAAQFVYNLMGPIFYELTMMALPSAPSQAVTWDALAQDQVDVDGIKLSTIVKFLCFVYMESAMQYESTEDVFDTLDFCSQFEVAELQEYCATSLKSFAEHSHGHEGPSNRLLGKKLCDYLVLFLGGRIPFYFNEEELSLLHSVFIETILDVFYGRHSEFDLAQWGIWWVQRKIMIAPPIRSRISSKCAPDLVTYDSPPKNCCFSNILIALAISSGVWMVVGGSAQSQIFLSCVLLLCTAIWTWVNSAQRLRQRRIILLLYSSSPDAVEGIIAWRQSVSEIIRCGTGS